VSIFGSVCSLSRCVQVTSGFKIANIHKILSARSRSRTRRKIFNNIFARPTVNISTADFLIGQRNVSSNGSAASSSMKSKREKKVFGIELRAGVKSIVEPKIINQARVCASIEILAPLLSIFMLGNESIRHGDNIISHKSHKHSRSRPKDELCLFGVVYCGELERISPRKLI
jgi:hypothetical protein